MSKAEGTEEAQNTQERAAESLADDERSRLNEEAAKRRHEAKAAREEAAKLQAELDKMRSAQAAAEAAKMAEQGKYKELAEQAAAERDALKQQAAELAKYKEQYEARLQADLESLKAQVPAAAFEYVKDLPAQQQIAALKGMTAVLPKAVPPAAVPAATAAAAAGVAATKTPDTVEAVHAKWQQHMSLPLAERLATAKK